MYDQIKKEDTDKDEELDILRKQVAEKEKEAAKQAELRKLEDELASIKEGRREEPSYLLIMI